MADKSNKEVFEQSLRLFVKSTENSKKMARKCSQLGLEHFVEHGDPVWLQRFYDAMPHNYLRRNALIKWACDHAPLKFEKGTFAKDKSDEAVQPLLVDAFKVDFWDYLPAEPELAEYTGKGLLAALHSTVKKFGGDKYAPKNDQASRVLHDVEQFLVREQTTLISDEQLALNAAKAAEEAAEKAAEAATASEAVAA